MCVRERERQTDRDRQTDRQTDKQRETEKSDKDFPMKTKTNE